MAFTDTIDTVLVRCAVHCAVCVCSCYTVGVTQSTITVTVRVLIIGKSRTCPRCRDLLLAVCAIPSIVARADTTAITVPVIVASPGSGAGTYAINAELPCFTPRRVHIIVRIAIWVRYTTITVTNIILSICSIRTGVTILCGTSSIPASRHRAFTKDTIVISVTGAVAIITTGSMTITTVCGGCNTLVLAIARARAVGQVAVLIASTVCGRGLIAGRTVRIGRAAITITDRVLIILIGITRPGGRDNLFAAVSIVPWETRADASNSTCSMIVTALSTVTDTDGSGITVLPVFTIGSFVNVIHVAIGIHHAAITVTDPIFAILGLITGPGVRYKVSTLVGIVICVVVVTTETVTISSTCPLTVASY